MATADPVTVLVLAGGAGTRFARRQPGTDKLLAPVGSAGALATLVDALLLAGSSVVVVGPARPLPAGVRQVREEPPGGGPLAGVAAGLALVATDVVVVLGGDQPFAASAVPRLVAALLAGEGLDAAVGVDPGGRRQVLLSAHRTAAARRLLTTLPVVAGRPLRELLAGRVVEVAVSAEEALDVDTPDDLAAARSVLARRRSHPGAGGPGAGSPGAGGRDAGGLGRT